MSLHAVAPRRHLHSSPQLFTAEFALRHSCLQQHLAWLAAATAPRCLSSQPSPLLARLAAAPRLRSTGSSSLLIFAAAKVCRRSSPQLQVPAAFMGASRCTTPSVRSAACSCQARVSLSLALGGKPLKPCIGFAYSDFPPFLAASSPPLRFLLAAPSSRPVFL